MEESFFKYFLDYGSLGVMAMIFFWMLLKNQKQLNEEREAHKEEQEKIRDRFQAVIEKYDSEKEALFNERLKSLSQLKTEIEVLRSINDEQKELLNQSLQELKELRTEVNMYHRGT
tara:strand:- start:12910 stop:13257 length:348 start_codon:yes stop_codon:yes gene_type:complete